MEMAWRVGVFVFPTSDLTRSHPRIPFSSHTVLAIEQDTEGGPES